MQKKSNFKEWLSNVLGGKFDQFRSEFVKKDGTIVDTDPLPGKLIVFRKTGEDQSKHTIRQNGNSLYLLIDKVTHGLISNNEGTTTKNPIQQGYDELTGNRIVYIDCGRMGGELSQ